MKILYCIILLALKAQANNKPHFTLKPKAQTEAFYGESINFTWMYSINHPLYRGSFGIFHPEHGTITKNLLSIDKNLNGTYTTAPVVSDETKDYLGRVRFVGDMAKRTVTIELSNIKNTDKTYYGIELEFEDDDFSVIVNATKLIVKTSSSFTASPGTQSLLRGKTARFPWKYYLNDEDKKLLKTISFGFYRQNKFNLLCFIEVTGMKTNSSLGKAKVVSMDSKNSITFEISQLELKHEATYALRFEGTLRPMESRSKIIVLDPPKIIGQPKSLNLKEHETLSLNCTASGKPIPLITWYKVNQVVQAKFIGIFTVNDTLKEDAGKYHCVAGNKVGNATSLTAKVDVQYSPIINTTSKFTIVHAPVGRKVQFKCPSLANPRATTSWYIKAQPHSKSNGQELEITIRNKYDYGNYTCRASNALGADQASFLLEEVGPPTQPKVDCENQGRSVVFRWVAPQDNGGAPVFAYTVKQRKLTSDNQHHAWINSNVSNSETWYKYPLQWQTTIELTVTAWNMYGESKLDLENTCIYTIGKDPALNTVVPTRQTTVRSVAADPALNTVVPTRQTTVRSFAAAAYDDSKDNQNTMVYVGICIALVALIAVVITFIVYRVKKNRKRKPCVPNVDEPSQQELSLLKTQPN